MRTHLAIVILLAVFLSVEGSGCAAASSSQSLPGMVTVTGTADVPADAEIPPRAILQVRMVNATLAGTDESQLRPGLEILAESIAYPGSQRPLPFTLEVPTVLFEDASVYEIRAELYVGPRRAFAATKTVKIHPGKDLPGVKLPMTATK